MGKIVPFDSIFINQFGTGLWTNRSPLARELDGQQRGDSLIDGLNIEVTNQRTLKRRPGVARYSDQQLVAGEIPRTFHMFRDEGGHRLMVDTALKVAQFTPTVRTDVHTLVDATKAVSFLDVLDTLYFSNGGATAGDQRKWDGTTVTKWGIATPAAKPTFTDAAAVTRTIDVAPTGASRTSNVSTFTTTVAHGFTVDQKVTVAGVTDTTFNGTFRILTVPTTTTFTVDNTGANGTSGSGTVVEVDLTAEIGYRYVFVFKNNTTGHISTGSPKSDDTEKLSDRVVTVTGARSTDTQVDKIEIYRTTDGGSTFFRLAEIANPGSGDWTYKDGLSDDDLGTLVAAQAGENDPPPLGLINLQFHVGRVWGSVDNIVYYGGGPDIINGVPEEAFPPVNFFIFPDTIAAMHPFSLGMLVLTRSEAYIIRGATPFDFFAQLIDQIGVVNEHAIAPDGDFLYAYTTDNQFVRVGPLGIEAAIGRVEEVGFTIGDRLASLSNVYVAVHRNTSEDNAVYISSGTTGDTKVFRYNLANESWATPAVITGHVRAMKSLQTSEGVFTLLFGRDAASGFLLKRDVSLFADDGTAYTANFILGTLVLTKPGQLSEVESIIIERLNAGSEPTVAYLPNEFGHTGFAGAFTTLTGPVAEAPEFGDSTTMTAKRYYLHAATLPRIMRHMQVRLSFIAEATANEILAMSIMGKASTGTTGQTA